MLPEAAYVGMSNSASFGMFPRSLTPPHDDPSCGYFNRTPEGKCTLMLCVDIPPTMLMHSNSPSTPPIFKSVSLGHTNPNTPHRDFAFESDGGLLVAPTNRGGGQVLTPVTSHSCGGGGDYLSTVPGHGSSPVWKGGRVQSCPILPSPGSYGPVQVPGGQAGEEDN